VRVVGLELLEPKVLFHPYNQLGAERQVTRMVGICKFKVTDHAIGRDESKRLG
jgi:hypothetical protein